MKKQILLLSVLVIFIYMGVASVDVKAGSPIEYNIESNSVYIDTAGSYHIYGSNTKTAFKILVPANVPGVINIALEDVNIDTATYAFLISPGSKVSLKLIGTNIIKSGYGYPGIYLNTGASLTITSDSTGSLNATGGYGAAGIGGYIGGFGDDGKTSFDANPAQNGGNGGKGGSCGIVNIEGGVVTATGGSGCLGIGGGRGGDGGKGGRGIYCGDGGNGGSGGDGGTIRLSGGTLIASIGRGEGGNGGEGGTGGSIPGYAGSDGGQGSNGSFSITGGSFIPNGPIPSPTNGSSVVYKTTITGLPANKSIGYSVDGIRIAPCTTDTNGNLYLWMPVTGSPNTILINDSGNYYSASGTVAAGSNTFTATAIASVTHVTGITVNPSAANIVTNNTAALSAVVNPSNAIDKSVKWSSSDPSVATVSNSGIVTAVGEGNAIITAATTDGDLKSTCSIVVPDTTPPSSYGVSFDQTAINSSNCKAVSLTMSNAEIDSFYNCYISDGTKTIGISGKVANANEKMTNINLSELSDGTLTMNFTLMDEANNTGIAITKTIKKDTSIPIVALNAPGGSNAPFGYLDNIVLNFSEAVTPVAGKTITLSDGINTYTYTIGTGSSIMSSGDAVIPSSGFKNGSGTAIAFGYGKTYTVSVSAGAFVDVAGNGNDAKPNLGSFTVEPEPILPSLSTYNLTIGEGNTGTFKINLGEGTAAATSAVITSADTGIATVDKGNSNIDGDTITVSAKAVGTTSIKVKFNDSAATEKTIAVTVKDITAPSGYGVNFDKTIINSSNNKVASFTLNNAEIGTFYEFMISNGTMYMGGADKVTNANQKVTGIDLSGFSDGILTLNLTLKDDANNTGATVTATIVKDTTGPEISLFSPNGTNVSILTSNIILSFKETVTATAGKTITLSDGTNTYTYTIPVGAGIISGTGTGCTGSIPLSGFVDSSNNSLILGYSKSYTVGVSEGAFVDTVGNGNTANPTLGSFTVAPDTRSSAKAITAFSIGSNTGTIDEISHTIAMTVPYGTNIKALAPNITVSASAYLSPANGVVQDFTNPVIYTVKAENETIQIYKATVTVAPIVISTGHISGTVTDGTKLLAGATVSVAVYSSVYSATTAGDGSYIIINVPVGSGYTLMAHKEGYNDGTVNNVAVTVSQTTYNVNLTVTPINIKIPVASITINGGDSVKEGETLQMTATVLPFNATEAGVTWSVAAITGNASINSSGVLTANSSGTVKVTAAAKDGSGISGTKTVTITKDTSNESGGSNDYSSSGESSKTNNITTDTINKVATATIHINSTADSEGNSTIALSKELIDEALKKAGEEAKKKDAENKTIEIRIDKSPNIKGFNFTLAEEAFKELDDSKLNALRITTPLGTFSFNSKTLSAINKDASGNVEIKVKATDMSKLSSEAKAAIGTRPAYEFYITSGNKRITYFDGSTVLINIPYTLTAGESPDNTVIFYIGENGELSIVPNCSYDLESSLVSFKTKHFSTYAVGYKDVSFSDISGWYKDYVNYLGARGIVKGYDGKFNPESSITRAELAAIIANLSGADLSQYKTSAFTDVSTKDWYFGAVQWAYENGIVIGSDGRFNPDAYISRQDITVMMVRYAENIEKYLLSEIAKPVDFTDKAVIADYAKAAVVKMQQAGIISGRSSGDFAPEDNATRAEACKMVAILLKQNLR